MSIRFGLLIFSLLSLILSHAQTKRGIVEVDGNQPVFTGNTYCIISGISRYQHIPSLDFADNDALAMRRFMMSKSGAGLDSSHILMFLNEEATAASIWIQSMKWIRDKNMQSGDRLLVYFSGHGDAVSPEEFYYLAHDCDPGEDKDNYAIGGTVPLDKLKIRFKNLTNEGVTVIFIMDACRTNELPGGQSGITSLTEGLLNKRTGELSLLATGPGSVSIESREYGGGHGLFTYILLEGLYGYADQNKDGTITLREVEKYVSAKVEEAAEKKSVVQIPEFCCPDKYMLPLFQVNKEGLLAYEAQKKKRNNLKEEYPVAKKGLTGKVSRDSTILGLYTSFLAQLEAGNFQGKGSAEEILLKMAEKYASEPLLEKAKSELAIALLDGVQKTINSSIGGDYFVNKAI
ncbi:MAG: caspase family protein, partial [Bacteroidota bacterium]|nr:caspase family protein [Bacteroidota bacterium]MDX5430926.1 caspase family protein [Bacteroidota bacterium]MDX5469674.1 caspase family protein [Bacteroidota bacterium]